MMMMMITGGGELAKIVKMMMIVVAVIIPLPSSSRQHFVQFSILPTMVALVWVFLSWWW